MALYRNPYGRFSPLGIYPGQRSMGDQLGPSLIRSPTAPGAAKNPKFVTSGTANAATSQTPTSILNGGKQTFGPLAYSRNDGDQEIPSQRKGRK